MRITGGEFRGRLLKSPSNRDIRPTSDKVRQAVFNMLTSRGLLEEAIVLDAFCGTGALGIEALSRGATSCTFIDKSRDSLKLCRENVTTLSLQQKSDFLPLDVTKPGPKPDKIVPADLLFLDPPYKQNLIWPVLTALASEGWMAVTAQAVLEGEKGFAKTLALSLPHEVLVERDYGDTSILLVQIHGA